MSPYGYPSGYGDAQAFPDTSQPEPVDYPYSMPGVPAILEPQQLTPGPPPPLPSRKLSHCRPLRPSGRPYLAVYVC